MSNFPKGSEWRKWDLHIHTPLSICQNYWWEDKFEEFITALEWLPEDVKVIGINDYYFLDWYEEVMKYKKQWRLSKIEKIFPILEFRIDTFASASENNFQKINLHILFDVDENDIANEIKKIKEEFINQIKISKLHPTKTLSKENFINESSDKKLKTGFNELVPSTDEVIRLLETSTWKSKTFKFLWYIEWNNLNKGTQLKNEKTALYNLTNAFFTASQTDNITKKEEVLFWFWNKPLLHSLDIHDFSKLCSENYKCFTWIKADPTFEGLKQINYEPRGRVFIWENKPAENFHRVSKIELKFWEDVKIKKKNNPDEYDFCFSWVQETLYLNNYFNCFIWWRWSGKSSLLNLIYNQIENKPTRFFEENELIKFNSDQIEIEDSSEKVEFLWQNEIEDFATDYKKFSKAIYDRLENKDELDQENALLRGKIAYLYEILKYINKKQELDTKLLELNRSLKAYEKVISIVKWEEYQEFQRKSKIEQDKLKKIKQSKDRYLNLKNEFIVFLNAFQKVEPPENTYDTSFNEVFWDLNIIKVKLDNQKFDNEESNERITQDNYNVLKNKYSEFLKDQWVSQEKLNDINKAQEWLHEISIEIPKLEQHISAVWEKINTLSFEDIRKQYEGYKTKIKKWLQMAQDELLKIKNSNVGEIKLEISFDNKRAKEELFKEFSNHFIDYKNGTFHWDKVSELLYNIDPELLLDESKTYQDLLSAINSWYTNWHQFLQSIFEKESNFEIYKILIAKYFLNLHEYLKINILYNGRPIESSSFWQKCTVVILIMILFWTRPIIIDEPEAHLDSSLIADYLVDLIKERKKERQIIFATHNANFVINWDADQIYVLENEDNKTKFIQLTIEDLDNREKLLKLEWWKNAFELRGMKYSSKKSL